MQAGLVKDFAATALGDRAWQRALGASCLLHSAVLAALLSAWHVDPQPQTALRPIPVTLVRTDEVAPERAAPPGGQTMREEAAPPPAPAIAAAKQPAPPAPPKLRNPVPTTTKLAVTPPTPAAKPSETITALLSESLDGGARRSGTAPLGASSAIALRSSAKLSDDYLLRLQAWIAREERYPLEARSKHQEGNGVVGFTIARDGNVTRIWIDQSTGSALLDQASVATIHDASPMLPLPHDLGGDSVDFYLPVNYSLSTFERLFQ